MNRRALELIVTPRPARVRYAPTADPAARRAIVDFLVRMLDRADQR